VLTLVITINCRRPFYKSGFSVVVSNRPHKADPWLFGMAFHWSVWILLVLTTVMMGVLVTLAEVRR
jgi:hypothetical protein